MMGSNDLRFDAEDLHVIEILETFFELLTGRIKVTSPQKTQFQVSRPLKPNTHANLA